jgi:hypothetical protein
LPPQALDNPFLVTGFDCKSEPSAGGSLDQFIISPIHLLNLKESLQDGFSFEVHYFILGSFASVLKVVEVWSGHPSVSTRLLGMAPSTAWGADRSSPPVRSRATVDHLKITNRRSTVTLCQGNWGRSKK